MQENSEAHVAGKALVRALFERVFSGREPALLDELVSGAFIDHSPHSQQVPGPDGLRWLNAMLHEICPDLRFDIDDMIGEGDTVAVRYTMSGTMDDGNPLEEQAIALYWIRDGRISERWAGLMR